MIQKYNWREYTIKNNIDSLRFDSAITKLPFLSKEVYIAGGALCDVLSGRRFRDIDIFFANEEARKELDKSFDRNEYPRFIKIDLVCNDKMKIFHYQTIEERIRNADFTITQFVFDGTYLYCGEHSLTDLKDNLLVENHLFEPFSETRVQRYLDKGFIKNEESIIREIRYKIARSLTEHKERMELIEEHFPGKEA